LGIGAAIADLFLERGYKAMANSRNVSRTTDLRRSDRLALVDGDIALATTAERILSTAVRLFGSLDALVSNAGIFFPKPFTEYTPEDVRALPSTNPDGLIYTTQPAMKQMLTQRVTRALII
jgi:NAD(P)-dependent dehydrogenase (short-subunit alcohol dehydrogenase family)